MTREPWSHVKILMYRTWAIGKFSKMAILRICHHLVSYSTFSQIILRHTFQYGYAMGQTVLKANSRVSKTKKIGQFPRLLSKNDKKKGRVIYTLNESSKSLQTIPPCIFYCGTTSYDFFFLALTKTFFCRRVCETTNPYSFFVTFLSAVIQEVSFSRCRWRSCSVEI